MTSNQDWLSEFKSLEGGKVVMGNNETCQVTGMGAVSFKMHDGAIRILKDVRLVPK